MACLHRTESNRMSFCTTSFSLFSLYNLDFPTFLVTFTTPSSSNSFQYLKKVVLSSLGSVLSRSLNSRIVYYPRRNLRSSMLGYSPGTLSVKSLPSQPPIIYLLKFWSRYDYGLFCIRLATIFSDFLVADSTARMMAVLIPPFSSS